MEDLQHTYRQTLKRHIQALESARAALLAGDEGARKTIRQIAHNLKGSGGTYGFSEISSAAEALEHADKAEWLDYLDGLLDVVNGVVLEGEARARH